MDSLNGLSRQFMSIGVREQLAFIIIRSGWSQITNIRFFLLLKGSTSDGQVSHDPSLPDIFDLFALFMSGKGVTQNPPTVIDFLEEAIFAPQLEGHPVLECPELVQEQVSIGQESWTRFQEVLEEEHVHN